MLTNIPELGSVSNDHQDQDQDQDLITGKAHDVGMNT